MDIKIEKAKIEDGFEDHDQCDEYGDIIPLDEFISLVKSYSLIDYDGVGRYLSIKHGESKELAIPSEILKGKINKEYRYVVWYNK